ncbi:hypothetical protein [Lewinella sp. IMCC34183]|uniref:hypothetical protein n=1 Tax=Lewinella sp. IMCC34183 TaxID=2248762 RepID=UPI000E27D6DD|nr:hypothetical protein [Lewinella sp. IMCC34183]
MPTRQTLHSYQPFPRACVRFLVVGCVVYFISLFVDGAFTLYDLLRASTVFGVSGVIVYHWQHLLTTGIGLTTEHVYHHTFLPGSLCLRLDRLRLVTVQEEYTAFSDSKTILTLYTPDGPVRLRISHLVDPENFLDVLGERLSAYPVELRFLEGDTVSTRSLREGI